MIKATFSLLFLVGIFIFPITAQVDINELRDEYLKALRDYEDAPEVYELFIEIKEPTAKTLAYQGALEAIMTKTTWNLFKKIHYLNKSEKSFNKAIKKSPDDVEIRFMRMAVQYEIPEYLGFSSDMEADRKFIVKNINDFDTATLSHETLSEIFRFMKKCNYFTDAQIEDFRRILALK